MIKVAINGYGRIGRHLHRKLLGHPTVRVVAVNSRSGAESHAYLLKYDSLYGRLGCDVRFEGDKLWVGDECVETTRFTDPADIPWAKMGIDVVVESTGRFTKYADAKKHLDAGAKNVIITAPCKDEEVPMMVMGVNEDQHNPKDYKIVSNASCTTNCLAPTLKVLNDSFGIEKAFVTTTHAFTKSQVLVDGSHKDPRRGRAAGESIIPTKTGAMAAIGSVIPELKDKIDGLAVRVPVATVSLIDVVAELNTDVTIESLNEAFRLAAQNDKEGIIGYCDEALVSVDFRGNTHSAVIDASSSKVLGKRMVKILAWYDNEWGYTSRLVDLIEWMTC